MAITTADELLHATELGRCELIRGELHRMNPAGGEHGRIIGTLTCLLGNHIRAHHLGTFYGAETGFVLARDPDTVRAPDFAFRTRSRPPPEFRGFIAGAPDLAVEVLSPDDRPGYVREKVAEWLEAGTRQAWLVDPQTRTIVVHETARPPHRIEGADLLHGGTLLPGFELAVGDVFA